MIRRNFYIFAFIAFMALVFTGPVVAQNLFLQGKSGESENIRPAPKKKGFFSKLFFGKGDEKAEKKKIVTSLNNSLIEMDFDVLDPSGTAPSSAEEYLARADALSAPLSQAYKQQKALSSERVAITNKIFKKKMKIMEARALSNQQNKVVQPVSFKTPKAPPKYQGTQSKTIRSKSPLLNSLNKNKKPSGGGVFKKY